MQGVENPIIIDQNYCNGHSGCAKMVSIYKVQFSIAILKWKLIKKLMSLITLIIVGYRVVGERCYLQ